MKTTRNNLLNKAIAMMLALACMLNYAVAQTTFSAAKLKALKQEIVLRYPSNKPGLPGHHRANAISMATPIAPKGVNASAKAEAMTLLDMFVMPEILTKAKAYFADVQTKEVKYISLVSSTDKPAINLNKKIMEEFRPEMKKYYYDPSKYATYMEQLGIKYPTIKAELTAKGTE